MFKYTIIPDALAKACSATRITVFMGDQLLGRKHA
jgi:hypothetical protein